MYSGLKWLGASVISIDMNLSNNRDGAQVGIELVEDIANGDSFTSGVIGTPYEITYGDITIRGILQSRLKNGSVQGNPLYTMRLVSPAELVNGATVILSDYFFSTSGVPNIFNVYGYWENKFGFGGSLVNDLGMVWEAENFTVTATTGNITSSTSNGMYGIKAGIEDLQDGDNNLYGNTIGYRGNTYKFDFDEVPNADPYWRFNGSNGSATLSEILDAVCGDQGYDWFPEISEINGSGPHTIKIRTIDRTTERLDGQIEAYAANKSGYSSIQVGQEANYDQTNLFLVGANREELWQQTTTSSIIPFWGFNYDGTPIIGAGVGDSYTASVNALEVSDIISDTTYSVSVAELRCALANQDVWAGFVLKYRTALAASMGLTSASSTTETLLDGYRFPHDSIMQAPFYANLAANANFNNNWTVNANRLYQFVLSYARDWYGKRFIVQTPYNISFKLEPDTSRVLFDWEPSDGAFLENGANPLGLDAVYEEYFQDSNYKFQPFVRFDDVTGIDPTTLRQSNLVLYGGSAYAPCRIMNEAGVKGIFYVGALSCLAIELENPAYHFVDDVLGGKDLITDLFAFFNNDWATYKTDTPMRYGPSPKMPSAVAMPVRSNIMSYGPWFTEGPSGMTVYRREDGLAPWNFGGYAFMDAAASGFIKDFVHASQVEENGSITYAGLPDRNVGDEIMTSGAIITNVGIQIGVNGVTTTYQLKNHTQQKGAFGRNRAERLSRIGQEHLRLGKRMMAAQRGITNSLRRGGVGTFDGRYIWNENISRLVKQETPYGALVGHAVSLDDDRTLSLISTQTFSESIQNVAYTGIFYNSACSSWDALLSPLSIDQNYTGLISSLGNFPTGFSPGMIDQSGLNHFADTNNVEWFLFGDAYSGIHTRKSSSDPTKARIMGHRAPLILNGWGYDIYGKPFPNKSGMSDLPQNLSDDFIDNYRTRPDKWIPAPLDIRYDPIRGVYGETGTKFGIIDGDITPQGTGSLALYYDNEVKPHRLPVKNKWFNTTLEDGHGAHAQFDFTENMWCITNVECDESNVSLD